VSDAAIGASPGASPFRRLARWLVIGAPFLWLIFFFLVPFAIVFRLSFSTSALARPPYTPTFNLSDGPAVWLDKLAELTTSNYAVVFANDIYFRAYLSSLEIAAVSTVILLLIGYPIAYGMSRAPKAWRPTLLMLVILPFWTSFLIRVYAWKTILATENGLLNQLLKNLGIIDQSLVILNTQLAVYIGIVYSYLPFMVLPLYAALERQDRTLLEASADLGAPPLRSFWRITFPMSLSGVFAGCFLVFIPVVGEYVIPDLLGGSNTRMIASTLWVEFDKNRDWPLAAAITVLLILILVVPIVFFQNLSRRELEGGR